MSIRRGVFRGFGDDRHTPEPRAGRVLPQIPDAGLAVRAARRGRVVERAQVEAGDRAGVEREEELDLPRLERGLVDAARRVLDEPVVGALEHRPDPRHAPPLLHVEQAQGRSQETHGGIQRSAGFLFRFLGLEFNINFKQF